MTAATAEQPTKADLAEALTNMAHTAARMPAHWTERRAELHQRINDMLDQYEAAR